MEKKYLSELRIAEEFLETARKTLMKACQNFSTVKFEIMSRCGRGILNTIKD